MNKTTAWPLILYGATGFSGLLAEQGFEKYVGLLVGGTASASAVVVFTYFLGFALGGIAISRLQRARYIRYPLILYGTFELLVGVACVLFTYAFHPLMEQLAPLQATWSDPLLQAGVRFFFGCLFVLPAAALMGASFPLVAQVVDEWAVSDGDLWTQAYSANLAGAALAALAGPYYLLPTCGVRGSFFVCLVICGAVFLATLVLSRSRPTAAAKSAPLLPARPRTSLGKDAWLLLSASFGSGLLFFALEVIWTHLIGAVLGSSIYAFSAMLLMVLLGLLAGARQARRAICARRPMEYPALFQKAALLMMLELIGWGVAPLLFAFTPPPALRTFYAAELYKLAVAAALILPPAIALGAIFPSLLGAPILKQAGGSWLVGYLTAANALGCLSGALLGLFVFIPVLGSENSLKAIIAVLVGFSLLFLWRSDALRPAIGRAVAAALIVLAPTILVHWDRRILTSGLNVSFASARDRTPGPNSSGKNGGSFKSGIVFFHEAAQGGITTVIEAIGGSHRVRTLFTNGKFQGDDTNELDAQFGLAGIPSQFARQRRRALLIGLGTGHSAAALKQLGYGEVDIAEFAPGIIDAARKWFAHLNRGVLDDPSVRLRMEDGRNFLLANRDRRYDLITIEVSSIWFAGSTNLYSVEFFELARRRLEPGGVLQQWIQIHHIGPRELASVLATARAAFSHVSLWYFGEQGMIVATKAPQRLDPATQADLTAALARAEGLSSNADAFVKRMADSQLLDTEKVDRFCVILRPPLNTDHNRWVEYATPRYYAGDTDWRARNLEILSAVARER